MNDNKRGLPPLNDLKNIILDFEHGECTVNGSDIGHCTGLSIIYRNNKWEISAECGNESITWGRKKFQ